VPLPCPNGHHHKRSINVFSVCSTFEGSNELLETTDSYAWDDGTRRREDEDSNELVETTDSYAWEWDDGTRRREDEGQQ
jgi:hypothetical protein